MPKLTDTVLHVRAFGRDVRVTAIFTDVTAANLYMENNPDEGVIANPAGVILIASVKDMRQIPIAT